MCAPARKKLRTSDVHFSNDDWRTPLNAAALPMASSVHLNRLRRVSGCLAPPSSCCAVPLLLPVREHPVYYPSISLVNIPYTQNFCEHLHVLNIFYQTGLIRVDVRLELNGANGPLIVSRSSLCLYQAPTPPPNRWPGLTTPPSRQVLARLAPLVLVFAVFLLPR